MTIEEAINALESQVEALRDKIGELESELGNEREKNEAIRGTLSDIQDTIKGALR